MLWFTWSLIDCFRMWLHCCLSWRSHCLLLLYGYFSAIDKFIDGTPNNYCYLLYVLRAYCLLHSILLIIWPLQVEYLKGPSLLPNLLHFLACSCWLVMASFNISSVKELICLFPLILSKKIFSVTPIKPSKVLSIPLTILLLFLRLRSE